MIAVAPCTADIEPDRASASADGRLLQLLLHQLLLQESGRLAERDQIAAAGKIIA
jgi:hypothetical protein